MLDAMPDQIVRAKINVRVDSGAPFHQEKLSTAKYLEGIGGKHVFTGRRSASEIRKFSVSKIVENARKLESKASSDGYTIVPVENAEYHKQDEFRLEDYVRAYELIDRDMPREKETVEDRKISQEEFLSWFTHIGELEIHVWTHIAVEKQTGLPVGLTETWLPTATPQLAHVNDTGVLAPHRGHRLGLTLKTIMLAKLLQDPRSSRVQLWSTFNADSNRYMLRINDSLGYRENAKYFNYELPIDSLESTFY